MLRHVLFRLYSLSPVGANHVSRVRMCLNLKYRMKDKQGQAKRCPYCGKYFKPDKRIGARQKTCAGSACQARRKKEYQLKWIESNPGCFADRYPSLKQWREEHPDYQRQWRVRHREIQVEIPPSSPLTTIRLLIPVAFKGKIQIQIALSKRPV